MTTRRERPAVASKFAFCAECGTPMHGAAYHAQDVKRDPWGRVDPFVRDDPKTPRFCSERCVASYAGNPAPAKGEEVGSSG